MSANKKNLNKSVESEIDLKELLSVAWKGKWIILIMTFLFSLASVLYALAQPNLYQSQVLLAPVDKEQGLGALQNQLGGLASIAGINLGGGQSNNTQLAIEILRSKSFVSQFIEKRNILAELMAADSWEPNTNAIRFDEEIYDEANDKWLRVVKAPFKAKPSMQEAHKVFMEILHVSIDQDTGMITASLLHRSPIIAKDWLLWLVEDINYAMKSRDVFEAQRSTEYLTEQISKTEIADIRAVLYKLIEDQAKTIMFANVRDEYVFKTIDPPLIPEIRHSPRRALICLAGAFLGGLFGMLIVIVRYIYRT